MANKIIDIIVSASDQTRGAFRSVSAGLDQMQARAGAVVGKLGALGIAVGGVVTALEGFRGIQILDQLDDLSEKTGISVEKLSELRYAGEAVGTPIEALATGMQKLAKQMADAAGGNKEAAAAFKAMGVEVTNTDGTLRSSEQVLGDVADKFASYEDGAGKAALAQRIFGKSGTDMIPLLNQGRRGIEDLRTEAEKLGAIYSGDLAKSAAQFNDNLAKIKIASEAAAVSISGPFIESLARLSTAFLEAKKNGGLLQAGWASYKQGVKDFWNGDMLGTGDRAKQREAALAGLSPDDMNDAVYRRFQTPRPKVDAPIVETGGDNPKKPRGGSPKDLEAEAKRYLESLDKQIERVKELSQVEIALAEIQRIRAEGGVVTESQKQQILLRAAEIDGIKELEKNKKAADDAEKERQKLYQDRLEEGKRLMESLRTPVEAYNAELKKLNELYDAGAVSSETYNRALVKQGKELEEAQKRAKESNSDLDEFAKNAVQNIQGSLGQGIADVLDGNYKSIGDSFSKMLNRMIAEAAAADLARRLFGGLAEGGEGEGLLGGALKTFTSALKGSGKSNSAGSDVLGSFLSAKGLVSNNSGGLSGGDSLWGAIGSWFSGLASFDVGTDYVPQDMLAVVHKGEKIIPAAENKRGSGGASSPYVIYYQAQPGESRKTAAQNGRALADQLSVARGKNS